MKKNSFFSRFFTNFKSNIIFHYMARIENINGSPKIPTIFFTYYVIFFIGLKMWLSSVIG